jgi:uncharacterized protein (TIGR02246 family)
MATQMTGSSIRDEIVRANEKFMETFGRKDAAGMAALYTEDGQFLPPNSDFVRGHRAIQQLFQGLFDAGVTMIELHTGEVEQHGDTAYEVSTAKVIAGDQVLDDAKYIVIWKREGGEWKLHRDIYNSSRPAA